MKERPRTTKLSRIAEESQHDEELIAVNDHVFVSKGMGDSILITGSDENVIVNTGLPAAGPRHRARFDRVTDRSPAYIVYTQGHLNQFGGTEALRGAETRIVAQSRFSECRRYWRDLDAFYRRRSGVLWGKLLSDRPSEETAAPEFVPDITFDDRYAFEVGGRRFEVLATPGGESLDALVVWLPDDEIAITGNLFGPLFGHLPNLYTIRGDKIRSALRFLDSLERVRALQPQTIVTGHEVIDGKDRIDLELTRISEAVRYIYDETIKGMNAGRDIHSLMREIELPASLQVGQGHGKTSWCVRAIWEEHAGWFHHDATTSLYGVPRSSVAPDLVELAGGPDALASCAEHHLDSDRPLEALHLTEVALTVEASNRRALDVKLRAHEVLLAQSGEENFSEVQWLRAQIAQTREALEAAKD